MQSFYIHFEQLCKHTGSSISNWWIHNSMKFFKNCYCIWIFAYFIITRNFNFKMCHLHYFVSLKLSLLASYYVLAGTSISYMTIVSASTAMLHSKYKTLTMIRWILLILKKKIRCSSTILKKQIFFFRYGLILQSLKNIVFVLSTGTQIQLTFF